MIVSKKSVKASRFRELLLYVHTDKGRIKEGDGTFAIFHNLRSKEVEAAAKEFKANDAYRAKGRGQVKMYHEWLSFHPEDAGKIDDYLLRDVAEKYIEIRGSNALCYCRPHTDNSNIHIHFVFSGSEVKSTKTLRQDNAEFMRCRREIENYQMKNYPELVHSVVYLKEKEKIKRKEQDKNTRKQAEFRLKMKTDRPTEKEAATETVKEIYRSVSGEAEFLKEIEAKGYELYFRRGKAEGLLITNPSTGKQRKYRFSTLGLDKENRKELAGRTKESQRQFENLSKTRFSDKWLKKAKEKEQNKDKSKDKGMDFDR